jgi:hypothetical protein
LAAGYAPAYPESSLDDPALAPVRTAIGHILKELHAELTQYVPELDPSTGHLGFAVPLHLRTSRGELHLMTTVTTFAAAVDVTLSELKLEAFLPADQATAEALQLVGNASTGPASLDPADHV